jgi:NitT/TauT family transport system substrate-binding protein
MKPIILIVCACVIMLAAACVPVASTQPQVVVQTVEVPVEATRLVEATAAPRTQVLFRQAWVPDDLYVPFTSALGKGYFDEAGIDFVNQVGSGAGTSTKVVASGAVPIGKGAANIVVQAIGEGLPITIIMTEMQADPTGVCSLPDSGITTPKDLEGAQIATSPGDAGQAIIESAMRKAGLDADSVNWVLMDPNLWNSALVSKQVQAIGCYVSNQPADLAAQGIDVNIVTVADMGLYVPGQVIFVNNDFLAKNRDLVKAFLTAVLKGYQFENTNPVEAAELMAKYYPEVDPKVIETKIGLVKPSWFSPTTDEKGIGWSDPASYENLQQLLIDTKVLTQPVDLSKALDNSILEEIPMELRTLQK